MSTENFVALRLPPEWLKAVSKELVKRQKKDPKITKQKIILERLAESYGIDEAIRGAGRPWPKREEDDETD